jgi:hypothetical protein
MTDNRDDACDHQQGMGEAVAESFDLISAKMEP